jgi:hypothetical protein
MYKILSNNGFGLEQYEIGQIIHLNDNSAKSLANIGLIEKVGGDVEEVEQEKESSEPKDFIQFNGGIFRSKKDLFLFMNLHDAKKILDEMKLKFWLNNGTLLGYYRDGTFIENDIDVDLGLFDYNEDILDRFKEYGFELYKEYGNVRDGLEYSFMRNGYKLDLFFFKKRRGGYYQYVWDNDDRFAYKFPEFTLKKIKFYGLYFNIPKNTDDILKAQYGEWKEPKSDWDYIKDPKNVCQK